MRFATVQHEMAGGGVNEGVEGAFIPPHPEYSLEAL
jgi:hypothetical protein